MALEKFHYELENGTKVSTNRMYQTKAGIMRKVLNSLQSFDSDNPDIDIIYEILELIFSKKDFNLIMDNATLGELMVIFEGWSGEEEGQELGK